MKISQELYNSGVLGHQSDRRPQRREFLNPGLPSYRQPRGNRRTRQTPSPRGWKAILDVFRRPQR